MRIGRLILAAASAALAGCATAPRQTSVAGDYLAGRLAASINAVDDAAAAYAEANRVAPGDIDILRDAFFFHLAAGDMARATPYAEMLVASGADDNDGLARLVVSARAIKLHDLKRARAVLAEPLAEPFVNSIGYLSEVWIEAERAGPDAAIARLDNPPSDVIGGFNPLHRALLAEKAGRPDEARLAYQAALAALGGPIARDAYGAFLERQGDADAARAYYAALKDEPPPARRVAEQAEARLDRGRASSAYAKVTTAKGAAIAYYSFAGAIIQQAANQRERAEAAGFTVGEPRFNLPLSLARVALYLDPDLHDARRLVALILSIYDDNQGAYDALGEIPQSSPYYEQSRIDMAGALVRLDRPDDAVSLLKDAIRREPKGVVIKSTLASVLSSQGDHESAVKALDAALASPHADELKIAWRLYISRGAALLNLDRWPEAEADLKRAVALAPDQAVALNYLGYSWVERGVNLDEAFAMIEKAVALQPDSGAIIDSLGWAHYVRGDYKEAVGHLEQAASLVPDDATISDHLGDVYWRLGRKTEAGYQWRRALELEPSEKLKRSLEDKIANGLKPGDEGA